MSFIAATDRRLNVSASLQLQSATAWVNVPVADLRSTPDRASGLETQLIFGQPVLLLQQDGALALVKSAVDGYVGYIETLALRLGGAFATHKVIVPRTFRYLISDMKAPRADALSIGSLIEIVGYAEKRGTQYALLEDGTALFAPHLAALSTYLSDTVAVAETLLHTPYLWGGNSGFGIDCSGLVQLCFAMCGRQVLRDTDMQAATIGTSIAKFELQRGDLIFWKGHVALYRGDGTIIHANGHSMSVAVERLDDAIARIGYLYGEPTAFKSCRV